MAALFQLDLAKAQAALENQEWNTAIQILESMRDIPDDYREFISNLLFKLYVARNRFDRLSERLQNPYWENPQHCLGALLLLRNNRLDYRVNPPFSVDLDFIESALEKHLANRMLVKEDIWLALSLLAVLRRHRLFFSLFDALFEMKSDLTDEVVEQPFACYLELKALEEGRRLLDLLRQHGQHHLALDRYDYLLRRASGTGQTSEKSHDKVLVFLNRQTRK